MKVYVASSWRNSYQQAVVLMLRNEGHQVYDFKNPPHGKGGFSWDDIDKDWKDWNVKEYIQALQTDIAKEGFLSDYNGMCWADCCVLVLPCGRSAHTEAGWMKGQGKRVIVLQPEKCEPELMYMVYDWIVGSIEDLKKSIKHIL